MKIFSEEMIRFAKFPALRSFNVAFIFRQIRLFKCALYKSLIAFKVNTRRTRLKTYSLGG